MNSLLFQYFSFSYCHDDTDQEAQCRTDDSNGGMVSVDVTGDRVADNGLDVAWILVRPALDADNW